MISTFLWQGYFKNLCPKQIAATKSLNAIRVIFHLTLGLMRTFCIILDTPSGTSSIADSDLTTQVQVLGFFICTGEINLDREQLLSTSIIAQN